MKTLGHLKTVCTVLVCLVLTSLSLNADTTVAVQPGSLNVLLTVQETAGAIRIDEPITSGVPIPHDVDLTDLSTLRLLDNSNQPVGAQFTPLARWGGTPENHSKPVRWLLLDFQSAVPPHETATYRLVNSGGALPAYPRLIVSDARSAVGIDTGVAQFSISKIDGRLRGPDLAQPVYGRVLDPDGRVYTTTGLANVTVALNGPMRASIQVKGTYRDESGKDRLDYTSRYWFYAGQPFVRLFHTVENNTLCTLDENEQPTCYDIGSAGSVTM
ncbi:MAG: hypothetical protein HY650_12600, partial [Acidobacteria bacterium]|nr:hypothetical protein [Acidobacteriota bacterium]